MPSYRHHNFGNLYIRFDVQFPQRIGSSTTTESGDEVIALHPEDIAVLQRILPPRQREIPIPADAMTDDFALEEIDPHMEEARARGAGEDDEDDMHPGAERVQCASQ
jgi:DnaJ family protein A protein 2